MPTLLILASIVLIDALNAVLIKRISHWEGPSQRVFIFFASAFFFSLLHFLISGCPIPWSAAAFIFALGCGNAFAAYAELRAIRINLSRTALSLVFPDLVAIGLAVIFLAEYKYLNWTIACGIVLCLISAALLNSREKSDQPEKAVGYTFLTWVAIFTAIWGLAGFATRYYAAIESVSAPVFVMFWYAGSSCSAFVIALGQRKSEKINTFTDFRAFGYVALFGLFIWVVRWLSYELVTVWPVVIAAPAMQIARMVVHVGIGCVLFEEKKGLQFASVLAIAGGIAGAMLVAAGALG